MRYGKISDKYYSREYFSREVGVHVRVLAHIIHIRNPKYEFLLCQCIKGSYKEGAHFPGTSYHFSWVDKECPEAILKPHCGVAKDTIWIQHHEWVEFIISTNRDAIHLLSR